MFRPDPSNLISPKPVNDSKISCVGAFRIHWGHIESIKLFFTSTMAGVEAGEVPFRHYDQVYSKVRKPWSNGGMIWKIFGWVDILDGVILTFTGWTYIYIYIMNHIYYWRRSRFEVTFIFGHPPWIGFIAFAMLHEDLEPAFFFLQFHSQNVNNMKFFNTRNLNRKKTSSKSSCLHSSFRQPRTCSELRTLWKCQRKWVVYKKRCRRDFWWCLNVKTQ